METIKAFIPAAGYGERLKPITDHIPKPLLPVLGRPVIEVVLRKLAGLSIDYFGINIHHKPDMLMQWLDNSPYSEQIKRFHEKKLLGTGGALRNAVEFLGKSVFIVHNADIITDIDLETLIKEHFLSGNTVTLAVHNYEKFNHVWIDGTGKLRKVGKPEKMSPYGLCKKAFTGIAVYSPDFLDFLPEGNSSVVDAWLKALASGKTIGTADYTGCSWTDIGTPGDYASAVFEALRQSGETIYVHPSVDCSKVEIKGYAVFENGSVFGNNVCLDNCILLPDAKTEGRSRIKDAIVGRDYVIEFGKSHQEQHNQVSGSIAEGVLKRPLKDLRAKLIGTGGSDRKYYRLSDNRKPAVLMVCSADDPDFERHIEYTVFFRRHSLPVPEILAADKNQKKALFEDLGDLSLYSWLKCRKQPEIIEDMYRKVIDILVKLHITVSRKSTECPLLVSKIFDYAHLKWETGYFLERFVSGLIGMAIPDEKKLNYEMHVLAETVDSFQKTIVHRDFQSQNIMIVKNEIPRVIDYQGARVGPPAYDIASILWDPYYRLDKDMRERLVCYYIGKIKADAVNVFFEDEFRYSLLLCRLQRHMQALGAYGFLSKVKEKQYFIRHIPQAMAYLSEETAAVSEDFPSLYELITKLNALYYREMPVI